MTPAQWKRARRAAFWLYVPALFTATHWPYLEVPLPGERPDLAVHLCAFGLWTLLLIGAGYFIGFHYQWGQTFGKMLMQIRVVRMDGGPLTLGQSIGRYFATYLSAIILSIGFIMAGFDDEKRALHDRICDTRVVKGK